MELLENVMLNESGGELEARDHRFVCYADDMIIFCKRKRAAERALRSVIKFLADMFFLKVNK